MRALISGISGFAGSHLAELLLREGYEVYGTIRCRSRMENIEHIKKDIHLIEADLRDSLSMNLAVAQSKPDYVFHLAAQSYVPMSWVAPSDTIETNVVGTINLFEAVRKLGMGTKVQFAGSSEEYGMVLPFECPIIEDNALKPLSTYGVSKVAGDRLSYQYVKSYGMRIIITRAFNHSGPRRGECFVTSNFAKQIAEIENGAEPIISVGNLNAHRDFTDVRDMVRAYLLAIQKCQYGVPYNICSGQSVSIRSVLAMLMSMSKTRITIEEDANRLRPSDVELLQGDCTQFKKATGWERSYTLDETLEDLLNYWRERCKK